MVIRFVLLVLCLPVIGANVEQKRDLENKLSDISSTVSKVLREISLSKNPCSEERLAIFLVSNYLFHTVVFDAAIAAQNTPVWSYKRNNDEMWRRIAISAARVYVSSDLWKVDRQIHDACSLLLGPSWRTLFETMQKKCDAIIDTSEIGKMAENVTGEIIENAIANNKDIDLNLAGQERHYTAVLAAIGCINNLNKDNIQIIYDTAFTVVHQDKNFSNPFTNLNMLSEFYQQIVHLSPLARDYYRWPHFNAHIANLVIGNQDVASEFSRLPREIIHALMHWVAVLSSLPFCNLGST